MLMLEILQERYSMSSETLQHAGGVPAETFGSRPPDALAVTVYSAMGRVITHYAEFMRDTTQALPSDIAGMEELEEVTRVSRYQQQRAQVAAHAYVPLPDQERGERLVAHYVVTGDDTGNIPRVGVDGQPICRDEMGWEIFLAELYNDVMSPRKELAPDMPITASEVTVLRYAIAWRAETTQDEAEVAELDFLCGLFGFKQSFLSTHRPGEWVTVEEVVAALYAVPAGPEPAEAPAQLERSGATVPDTELAATRPRPLVAAIRKLVHLSR
jgi:hypothetical protein